MKPYKTIDLARQVGIHPNTVRLYERIGFIAPVPRGQNGYRLYNEKHLYQIKIARCIYGYDWLGRTIRAASLKIIESVVRWDLDKALEYTYQYLELIQRDYIAAKETAEILERWTRKSKVEATKNTYTRREAAKLIGTTEEVLRNWERSGLIEVPRTGINNVRIYGDYEIERLRIIYMLRQSKYSISAIFQSLSQYDRGNIGEVITSLNVPDAQEYQSWIWVGDRWIKGLERTAKGGEEIISLIKEAKDRDI